MYDGSQNPGRGCWTAEVWKAERHTRTTRQPFDRLASRAETVLVWLPPAASASCAPAMLRRKSGNWQWLLQRHPTIVLRILL